MQDNTVKTGDQGPQTGFQIPRLARFGIWSRVSIILLSLIFVTGIAAYVLRWQQGWGDRAIWGYYTATFSFLLSTAQAAPIVSVGLRLVGGPWRRPLARPAELFTLVGILNLLWFLPLLRALPATPGKRSLWFTSTISPQFWETTALAVLVVCGLGLLYLGSLPDLEINRSKSLEKEGATGKLSLSWRGNPSQWRILQSGLLLLGVGYFLILTFQQTIFATDFAMSLVPGWKDALFPAYHIVSSLQAGTALVTISVFLLRKWGGLKDYIGLDTFKGLGRLLLVLTLLWFYFWWSSFIVLWYGRRPEEQLLLQLFVSGANRPLFVLALSLNFVLPFLLLLWSPIRKSIAGPTIVSVFILFGTLFDRIRIFTAAFSVKETGEVIKNLPPARLPDTMDIFILVGGIAGMALIYLLAIRLLPALSFWEITQGHKLEAERQLGRLKMRMIAKAE